MTPIGSSPHLETQAQGQEAARKAILDVASGLLRSEGAQALSMRRIAAAAGCSTMVLYTLFRSKHHVAEGLYLEGFARLSATLHQTLPGSTPLAYVTALGHAYRASALANPNYYGVMFGHAIPEFIPSPESRERASQSLKILQDAVQTAIEAGVLRLAAADEGALILWTVVHGAVSLELGGYFGNLDVAERRFDLLLQTVLSGLQVSSKSETS